MCGKLMITKKEGKSEIQQTLVDEHNGKLYINYVNQTETTIPNLVDYANINKSMNKFDFDGCMRVRFENLGVAVETYDNIGESSTKNSNDTKKRLRKRKQTYVIAIECHLLFENNFEVVETVYSQPFLITINNERKEEVIGPMIWSILAKSNILSTQISSIDRRKSGKPTIRWIDICKFLQHYLQSEKRFARELDRAELLHLQAMLFMPIIVKAESIDRIENDLFGGKEPSAMNKSFLSKHYAEKLKKLNGIALVKYRLMREFVQNDYAIYYEDFFETECVNLVDITTRLQHTFWSWFYRAIELICDRNPAKLLCQDMSRKDKKTSMMLQLFNERIITMSSIWRIWQTYRKISNKNIKGKIMVIRFCENYAGNLSFSFTNDILRRKPYQTSLSSNTIKDLPLSQSLAEYLLNTPYAKQFNRLIKYEPNPMSRFGDASTRANIVPKKRTFSLNESKKTINRIQIENDLTRQLYVDPFNGPNYANNKRYDEKRKDADDDDRLTVDDDRDDDDCVSIASTVATIGADFCD